jgi:hypothetical protein
MHAPEKCSDICAETVGIGFHARKALHPAKSLFSAFLSATYILDGAFLNETSGWDLNPRAP